MSNFKDELNSHISTARIEALSDGVFAIAMTLLVLDLNVPNLAGTVSNQQLSQALWQIWPNVFAFVLAFLLLGNAWAVHHRQFALIQKWDDRFVMINTLRLLIVVCIPFTTSLIAHYGNLTSGALPFATNFFLLAMASYWQWDYAIKHNLIGAVSARSKKLGRQKSLFAALVAILAMLTSLVAPALSPAVFMLNFTAEPVLEKINHE